MKFDSVVWEWGDRRGLEHLRLFSSEDGLKADGLIIVDDQNEMIRLRYSLSLRSDWRLRRCGIFAMKGGNQNTLWLSLEDGNRWVVDGGVRPDLDDCINFDIKDSPFPKAAIIRSLGLEEGRSKTIEIACIDNRRLIVSSDMQTWERLPPVRHSFQAYRCTSSNVVFEFDVNKDFFVLWGLNRWRVRSLPFEDLLFDV